MKKLIFSVILCFLLIFTDRADACTTFIISGKYTADGKPILYKNRDTKEMKNSLVLFEDGKYLYMGVVNGTEESWNRSVWGGYNETGFGIINSAAYNNNIGDTSTVKERDGIIMKLALMYCSSLADFEKLLDTLPKPLGVNSNYGVIDAYGGVAYYETGNFKYVKFDANDPAVAPNGIIIRTNHSMSSDLSQGFGFNRYDNATRLLNEASQSRNLTPRYLLETVTRNLYHPRVDRDLSVNIPEKRDQPKFEFFIDFIPRFETSSAFMIVGAKDEKNADKAMMWTILGFPLTSVAVPTWLSAGELPKAVAMDTCYQSPLCTAALQFKDECFPIKIDKGQNYINMSVVLNQEGTGYMQLLQPIEKEIFERANSLIDKLEKNKRTETDIHSFYRWIDQFLSKKYLEQFNINLMNNMN